MQNTIIISNRANLASAGGWIHIVPKGELPNAEAGIVQVLDDTALDSIMANIAADKARLGDNWPGIYAGREHFIYDPDQDSAALAWFKDFQNRDDGIWANDDGLTPGGSAAIKNGEYKFTSFCADPGDLQKMPGQSGDGLPRFRVMKIETVGFTNQANGKDLLTPITNRKTGADVWQHAALVKRIMGNSDCDFVTAFDRATEILNRETVPAQAQVSPQQVSKEQLTQAQQIQAARGCSFTDAWNEVQAANPSPTLTLAYQIKASRGCSFDQAWTEAQQSSPVTNRQPGQPAGAPRAKRFTSAPAAAAATLRDLAGELTGKGMTFQKAWGVVCNRHPAIFKMANRRVVNRRAGDPDVDPADWKEANACEADVLAQLNSEIVQPMDRGTIPTFSGPAGDAISRGTFRRVVQRMMTDDGLTLQQASDKLKQDEPIFWTLAMLALKQDK